MSKTSIATACISSFRRPEGLERLLRSLASTTVPVGWSLRVVVVDNDHEGSAKATIASLSNLNLDLVYDIEPRQGIPYARNRTTELAFECGTDELIFIDDDEWVEQDWLVELIDARRRHKCPIVMGSVIAEFEEPPPLWAIETDAYQRRIRPDGTELDFAITANVIVDANILGDDHRPFDESLRFGGGEDLLLFQRLNRSGHQIVSAPAAKAHELIPKSRVNKAWLVRRHYRRGLNRSVVLRLLNLSLGTVTKRVVAAMYEMAVGAATLSAGLVRGPTTRLRGRMRAAYGFGLLAGLTGRQNDEYKTIHGK